jgi:hypothetical protein
MAMDDLLRISGPSAGISIETATVDAAGGGGYKRVGPNKQGYVECWAGGLFDRTTGDETITWTVKRADDAAGTNAATVGTSAAQAANNRGLGSTATQDTLGMVTAPTRVAFTTTVAQQYVGITYDMTGTTPSVAAAHAHIVVSDTPVLNSGV